MVEFAVPRAVTLLTLSIVSATVLLAQPARPQLQLQWSFAGPVPGMHCLQIEEPADPHTWNDNFLCTPQGLGLRWSFAGPIAGMNCVNISEPADPHTWSDNYLCSVKDFGMEWSTAGPLPGRSCLQINEPADPHTWNDNFLCFSKATVQQPTGSVAVCAFTGAPLTNLDTDFINAAQMPGRQLLGWAFANQRDVLLIIVDDAPQLGPDEMLVEVDIDAPRVSWSKAVEAWSGCSAFRVGVIESQALRAFNVGFVCEALNSENDFRSRCTTTQIMRIGRSSASQLWFRKPGFLGIWYTAEGLDDSMWRAFGGRSVRFVWRSD